MKEIIQKVNSWHEDAMDLAEMAFFAKRRNEIFSYLKYIQRALNYEKAAAKLLRENYTAEPTRSVIYLGAIHFAINSDTYDEAAELIEEAFEGNPPEELKAELEVLRKELITRDEIKKSVSNLTVSHLEKRGSNADEEMFQRAWNGALAWAEVIYGKETLDQLLNRIILQATLESRNLITNPNYQVFASPQPFKKWVGDRKEPWTFWDGYKNYLFSGGIASNTIAQINRVTDDILNRIGDPTRAGQWQTRGMVVGDVQSGKTSNYIGLINKAADAGFRIIIVMTGLYENLRQQTQIRLDEGFIGAHSNIEENGTGKIGVGLFRQEMPVHPLTRTGENGDIRAANVRNNPLDTKDHYVMAIKKNPVVLKYLLTWLHSRGEVDGDYRIIRNIPLLIIDDEADYASINVDKSYVSKINASIRSLLGLFEQSAFIGYTATPFANVFISDHNKTQGKDVVINKRKYRLGKDLFPESFVIQIPPPANYIGYNKVFNVNPAMPDDEGLDMITYIKKEDYQPYIPDKHKLGDKLPEDIPQSLKDAVDYFIIVCAVRYARNQDKSHSSMLVHVSWYVKWINHIAEIVDSYLTTSKNVLKYDQSGDYELHLKSVWENELKGRTDFILSKLEYDDAGLTELGWEEIQIHLADASQRIVVRAVHGKKDKEHEELTQPLDYDKHPEGLFVIAVGGNKLSRGLTLEGLSVSYFLRATRFYDTLMQMGRWFGYRPGYADLCRVFTTEQLVGWYHYIGNASEELKEQFDIMDLSDRTPDNFGLKVRTAPGMLMISSAAKIRGATDLSLSLSGQLLETYRISKNKDILQLNLNALSNLIAKLGATSGKVRQSQQYIWENVRYPLIDEFLGDYQTQQLNIQSNIVRGYITRQQKSGTLTNWTVVLISSSDALPDEYMDIDDLPVGYTSRLEVDEDRQGNKIDDDKVYVIRNSHIISPPHEFLDMEPTDPRFIAAKDETIRTSEAKTPPKVPSGKFVRKYRGHENALLILYLLNPKKFKHDSALPAAGYAISLPAITGDKGFPYKVNKQFLADLFDYPKEAEEHYTLKTELV
ncbi:Z1 domain-containing protein [Mucilaginibacter sp. dw_454]|uniref:Z1 domain-containing protein n=1 Tax=Mucilaginibacter sp. dw_454 TaxID=2720079 RepID=UPI001BD33370|nr:Z1 domain-containing protein [Mucilaginibacter sp. dw_454]